jgi:hypothetical protein
VVSTWPPTRTCADFLELFESQLISRHLDLMARVLRVQNKVFYTIGSSGHEGNAMVARLTRHTDPAFLHYRSGAFMAERFRKLPGMDPIMDSALSFAASRRPGLRWPPQGLGQQAAVGAAADLDHRLAPAQGAGHRGGDRAGAAHRPRAADSATIPSRSVRSATPRSNHATAQTAFNAAAWTAYQKLPAPVLFVCEDNGIGISVKTPDGWIGAISATARPRLFLRRRPRSGQRLRRGASARSSIAAHAPPDLPAPAHHAHHGPRRHRLRDRVAQHRGTVRGRGRRSAAAFGADRAGIRA